MVNKRYRILHWKTLIQCAGIPDSIELLDCEGLGTCLTLIYTNPKRRNGKRKKHRKKEVKEVTIAKSESK